jgi:DNA-binding MarR family transcriptional regulator
MTKRNTKPLADFLPYQLSITANAVSNLIAREYESRFGLKIFEWRIMAVLGDVGQATQSALVDFTLMDKVAVNRACKVLADRQLIERRPHGSDRRSHQLQLTGAGNELHDEIMPLAVEIEKRLLGEVTAEELEMLTTTLLRLRDASKELIDAN